MGRGSIMSIMRAKACATWWRRSWSGFARIGPRCQRRSRTWKRGCDKSSDFGAHIPYPAVWSRVRSIKKEDFLLSLLRRGAIKQLIFVVTQVDQTYEQHVRQCRDQD